MSDGPWDPPEAITHASCGRLIIRILVKSRVNGALEPILPIAVEVVVLYGSVALLSGNDDVGVTVLTGDFVDVADSARLCHGTNVFKSDS